MDIEQQQRLTMRNLFYLFGIALLVRLTFVIIQTFFSVFVLHFYAQDSGAYDALAQSILQGTYSYNGSPTVLEPPGYPVFLALNYLFFGRNFLAIGIVQSFIGAVSAVLVAWIGLQLFSKRTGYFAGLLFSFYPHSIFWTGFILTDTLYVFLTLLFLAFAVSYKQSKTYSHLIGAAVALGLALLTRATLLPFLLIFVVFLWIVHSKRSQSHAKSPFFIHCAVFAFILLLVLAPWIGRNYAVFGKLIVTDTKSMIALAEAFGPNATGGTGGDSTAGVDYVQYPNAEGHDVEHVALYRADVVQGLTKHPERVVTRIPHKLWNMWRPNYAGASLRNNLIFVPLYVFMVLFGCIGVWLLRKKAMHLFLLYAYLAYHVVLHGVLYGIIRYRLPVEPVMLLFAAEGSFQMYDGLKIAHAGILEAYLQKRRMKMLMPYLSLSIDAVVLDLGCGKDGVFLRTIAPHIRQGTGIDPVLPEQHAKRPSGENLKNLRFIRFNIQKKLPIASASCSHVVSLAVFGCFTYRQELLNECYRVLRQGGILVFTIPMPSNEYLMAVLWRIGLLNKELVQQYKYYHTPAEIRAMLEKAGFADIQVKRFQLGLNSIVVARKR